MCRKMSKESYSYAAVKSKDKKEATERQPIDRRCSAASFFRSTFLALYLKLCCPEVWLRHMMPLNYVKVRWQ